MTRRARAPSPLPQAWRRKAGPRAEGVVGGGGEGGVGSGLAAVSALGPGAPPAPSPLLASCAPGERSECLFNGSQYPFVLIGLSSFAA